MILENVKVLAAGTQMERKGKDEEPKQVQVITVEVDVEEAEKLALASTQGDSGWRCGIRSTASEC